jgi:hypothetical protein
MLQRLVNSLFRNPSHAEGEVALPKREPTTMETQLRDISRVSVEISHPSKADIQELSKLPQGTLTALWLEARFDKHSSVELYLVGRDAHANGPYALMRAKNKDMFALDTLRRSLKANLDVHALEDISVSRDESSCVVRFPRERGMLGLSSDRELYGRALRLVTDPSPYGADEIVPTRLILKPGHISWVARVNGLGEEPYTVSHEFPTPRVLITRE